MKFTFLPMFTRDSIAWSVLLLAAPFAGNLLAAEAVPVTQVPPPCGPFPASGDSTLVPVGD